MLDWLRKRLGLINRSTGPTYEEVLDSYSNGFSGIGRGRTDRDTAILNPALVRCASLISAVIAKLVTNGSMRVHDADGNIVDTPKSRRILTLFNESLDGIDDSSTTIEDLVVDYCLEGNSLAKLNFNTAGTINSIHRLDAFSAEVVRTSDGNFVYRATTALATGSDEIMETISARNIAHARFPMMQRSSGGGTISRSIRFSAAPITLINKAINIAILEEAGINEFYTRGQRSNLGIGYPEKLSADQQRELRNAYQQIQKTSSPFIVDQGATFTNIKNTASNADSLGLREFQVAEVSRIFGIPGPLLNQNTTSWGQGIAELAKLAWRFGLSQHTERFLAPYNFRLLGTGQRFKVDASDLLRGDVAAMARLLTAVKRSAQQDETMTVEEQRMFLGLPKTPISGVLREAVNDTMEPDAPMEEV